MPDTEIKQVTINGVTHPIKDETARNDKVDRSGDTMQGPLVAQNNTNYTVKQVRNIIFSTGEPTAGDGNNGDI